jgi:biotin operon repressor
MKKNIPYEQLVADQLRALGSELSSLGDRRREQVYEVFVSLWKGRKGTPPSSVELARKIEMSPSAVRDYIRALAHAGRLLPVKDKNGSRVLYYVPIVAKGGKA